MQSVRATLESRLSEPLFVLGVVLVVLGAVGFVFDELSWIPLAGPGLRLDLDIELLGIVVGGGATLSDRMRPGSSPAASPLQSTESRRPVYITRALLTSLLQLAEQCEPETLSVGLAVTHAGELTGGDDVSESTPVFTHRYLPERPNSVSSVFGVDLQTPARRTHGRFVTHPFSELSLTKRDDLHEVILVAVPPWDEDAVAAFDRRGRRRPLRTLDAVPPDESLPWVNQ